VQGLFCYNDAGGRYTTMIAIRVKLFATLRQRYPGLGIGEPMTVELPEDTTTGQLLAHLQIPDDQVKIIFVNNVIRDRSHQLADGDEVGIFPPVGGG
jgi:molybdopterin synthase sulfur carrier subunit